MAVDVRNARHALAVRTKPAGPEPSAHSAPILDQIVVRSGPPPTQSALPLPGRFAVVVSGRNDTSVPDAFAGTPQNKAASSDQDASGPP